MGVGAAIKKGFGVAGASWPLIGLLFLFNLVWNLGSIPFAQKPPEEWAVGTWVWAVLFIATFLLLAVFVQGGMLGYALSAVKEGKAELSRFWQAGRQWFGRLFGLGLVLVLCAGLVGLVFVVTFAMALGVSLAWENNIVAIVLANILAVAISGVALYFLFLLFFAPYAMMCDQVRIRESLKRSVHFVRSSLGRVVLLLVLLVLVSLVAMLVVGLVALLMITLKVPTTASDVIVRILSSGINSYLGVVTATSLIGFYVARGLGRAEAGAVAPAGRA